MTIDFKGVSKTDQNLISRTIKEFGEKNNFNFDFFITVKFVTLDEIKKLNFEHRKINEATDVLSFPIWEKFDDIPKNTHVNLGDIVICPEFVKNSPDEIKRLVKHSMDHLIGIHH